MRSMLVHTCGCVVIDVNGRGGWGVNIIRLREVEEICQYLSDVLKRSLLAQLAVHQQWEESIKMLLGLRFDMVQHGMGWRAESGGFLHTDV